MIVFVVYSSYDYEGGDVMAVCSSRDNAESVVEELKTLELQRHNVVIEEWEINDVHSMIKNSRERQLARRTSFANGH